MGDWLWHYSRYCSKITGSKSGQVPDGKAAIVWALVLSIVTGLIAYSVQQQWHPEVVIVVGLMILAQYLRLTLLCILT